jgi:hypothetical protein
MDQYMSSTEEKNDGSASHDNIHLAQSVTTSEIETIQQQLDHTCDSNTDSDSNNVLLDVVKYYYQTILKYPHVYSGLQFGCHYVLYRDHPQVVHSTYAIYVVYSTETWADTDNMATTCPGEHANHHTSIPWYTIQTLVRMMADLHKTLILVHIEELLTEDSGNESLLQCNNSPSSHPTATTVTGTSHGTKTADQQESRNIKVVHYPCNGKRYCISELTITTEHAPFRQHQQSNPSKVT